MLIHVDGVRLFALEAGTGEPALVFIHGNGADHTAWHNQIAFFSPLTRVVALDQRGHGQSARDPDRLYSQDKFLADLLATLDVLRVESAILVGWSMGASVAARFAVENPSRAAGLVLVDHNLQAARAELGVPARFTEDILRDLSEDFEGRGCRSMVDSWFPETGPEIDALKAWLYEVGRRTSQEVMLGIRSIGVREDRRRWLEQLSTPTLVLQGGASFLGGRRMGEYLANLIPGAELYVFEGKGHCLFLTAPDEFNQVLRKFLLLRTDCSVNLD